MSFRSITGLLILILSMPQIVWGGSIQDDVLTLQHDWAKIKYQWPKHDRRNGLKALLVRSRNVRTARPGQAGPLIWNAVVLYTYAGEVGGLRALSMVKKAHTMLLEAEKIDAGALNGYAHVALGSLYYKTPGRPIAFGNKARAKVYLQKAITINPHGLDAHYFMGDFLLRRRHYAEAAHHLEQALAAPARPLRPIADAGRKADARKLLARARKHLH